LTGPLAETLLAALRRKHVPRAAVTLDADALRRWAAARTEPYKVPDGIHFAKSLPLGATGKADRAALARMIMKARSASGQH
jgi:acyl-coenzyme A synthetase/AMP-(fatty) acid ligase